MTKRKVGDIYWQKESSGYRLYQVVSIRGSRGRKSLSPHLKRKETWTFARGWNSSNPRRKRLKGVGKRN